MGHQVTLGGERLGAGKRQKIELHNYERSTHKLSYVWRSTMASGTLVPFLSQVALPGDTFDIDLDVDILTHPTIGPLFGTYKIQLDIFQIPIRLYQGQLHMNMLGIGLDMSKILLPQVMIQAPNIDKTQTIDNQQMNPSAIFSYLGIRGVGVNPISTELCRRKFNAIPWLGYWDIYKNYYANKQEEIGYVVHKDPSDQIIAPQQMTLFGGVPDAVIIPVNPVPPYTYQQVQITSDLRCQLQVNGLTQSTDLSALICHIQISPVIQTNWPVPITELFANWTIDPSNNQAIGTTPIGLLIVGNVIGFGALTYSGQPEEFDTEPQAVQFPLSNIDEMRKLLLAHLDGTEFLVNDNWSGLPPYNLPLQNATIGAGPQMRWSQLFSQEGLGLKTYNSDLFNNWIQTEWIDGPDGISAVTAVDTSGGSFTIDELNLAKKVYDMLNRIAISGGSYDDWLDAVYTHKRQRSAENPMYLGGLMQNLVFQEVISNAQAQNQPLGTLAGRGTMGNKRKGGSIIAKVDEPSYLMGIISITPNIDYSQGNQWDTNLATMNDFHKPALDQIGFQDLVTDQMAWWDTQVDDTGATTFKSAGKQPAWINYMTNVNQVRGNFADQAQQMFMVLNRRYDPNYQGTTSILDLTTYIDPTKFNHIFADTRRDAQNFWAQVGVHMIARRKMSAKVMPNL